jgi:anti-sigma factor RsiW
MSCPPLETVVAWALDELPQQPAEQFEEHYFGCDLCFRRAQHVQRLVAELDASLPPVLTSKRRDELTAAEPRMPAVKVRPGERATLHLGGPSQFGIWVMQAPVENATRVDFEARDAHGELLFAHRDVPFDAARSEVVLACQVHYRALPVTPQFCVRLSATDRTGRARVSEYFLDHEFESP